MTLMLQNNKTRRREVGETYLGGIDSAVQDEKLTLVWTGLACFRRSDVHSVGIQWRVARTEEHGGKEMEKEYLPTPPPTPYPSSPGCFFLLIFLCTHRLRAEALRSPPHYRQSHFVLRVRDSRDCSRKTTSSKNDLHGVEPPYLLPLLLLSSAIIRVIVRNVPVWESYVTNLSHDRLRAGQYFRLE